MLLVVFSVEVASYVSLKYRSENSTCVTLYSTPAHPFIR